MLQNGPAVQPATPPELFRVNDGHGSRIIVEKVGDDISVTVRHSGDPRDAETVVLSREVAHALLVALENVI